MEAQDLHITFHAADDGSPIRRAEYSIDAGDWQYVEPVGALSDAKSENYDFTVLLSNAPLAPEEPVEQKRKKGKPAALATAAPAAEHVVVVRVYDRADNVATAKYVTK
jgi:hypothetical protein